MLSASCSSPSSTMNYSDDNKSSPSPSLSPLANVNDWEVLRRTARQYESELDSKLSQFGELRLSADKATKPNYGLDVDQIGNSLEPLIAQSLTTRKDTFEKLCGEIESLLGSLQDVIQRMEYLQLNNNNNKTQTSAVIQRLREILRDSQSEYHKIQAKLDFTLTRDQLLGPPKNDSTNVTIEHSKDPLVRENECIRRAEILIDQQIYAASGTRDTLRKQRSLFNNIHTKLGNIANSFPRANNIMRRILMKRRKDSIILSLVIGACLFLMLLYMFPII